MNRILHNLPIINPSVCFPLRPGCIQPGDVESAASSEDCLYLNIFTPAARVSLENPPGYKKNLEFRVSFQHQETCRKSFTKKLLNTQKTSFSDSNFFIIVFSSQRLVFYSERSKLPCPSLSSTSLRLHQEIMSNNLISWRLVHKQFLNISKLILILEKF